MASLTDTQIDTTYVGLLKTSDNGDLSGNTGASAIGITDGIGTATSLFLSTSRVGIGTTSPNAPLDIVDTSTQLMLRYNATRFVNFNVNSAGELTITPYGDSINLAKNLQLVTGIIENGSGETTIQLTADQKVICAADVDVTDDLTFKTTASKLIFGNGEYIRNNINGLLEFNAQTFYMNGSGSSGHATASLDSPDGYDSRMVFKENTSNRWAIGHDTTANSFAINVNTDSLASSTAELEITTDGDMNVKGVVVVKGDSITIGGSDDSPDKSVLFRHDNAASIIGIDNTHDRFIINTDATFDATANNNSFTIDVNNDVTIAGDLTIVGNDIKSSTGDTAITLSGDDVIFADNIRLNGDSIEDSTGTQAIFFYDVGAPGTGITGDLRVASGQINRAGGSDNHIYMHGGAPYLTTIRPNWTAHSAAASTGLCLIRSSNGGALNNAGWLSVYINEVEKFIPYFDAHAG